MARVTVERQTTETSITLKLNPYGSGEKQIKTGIGFFDHMLELFAFHGRFDIEMTCKGDLHVDGHHTVEDVGIVLGQAFAKAIPSDVSLKRYAERLVPMDEALARAVVDVSGRPHLVFDARFESLRVGDFDTELVREFFQAFVNHARLTLHLKIEYGENTHHMIEALFKASSLALREAIEIETDRKGATSTKGVL
ncbi:imidazoleglycerol-phosphate dehydratase HisB [bacterium]|nr:imidazoleglycerol-phosphate dehydratase HisB [bacterium]